MIDTHMSRRSCRDLTNQYCPLASSRLDKARKSRFAATSSCWLPSEDELAANAVWGSSACGAQLPELGEREQQAERHKQNNQSYFGPVLWRQSPLASLIRKKLDSHEFRAMIGMKNKNRWLICISFGIVYTFRSTK